MFQDREYTVLNMELQDAGEKVNNIHKGLVKYSHTGSVDARKFYYTLASYSAGAITFSVTFISYISTTGKTLYGTEFLFAAWTFLLLSMFGSIYRNHFHGNFFHYQLNKRYMESKVEHEDKVQQMLTKYPEQTFNDYEGIDNLKSISQQRQSSYEKAKEYHEKEELKSNVYWTYLQKLAHWGFIAGMTLIVIFAMLNLK